MTKVQRYDCARSDCYGMERCEDGDYVLSEDYEKLLDQLARMQAVAGHALYLHSEHGYVMDMVLALKQIEQGCKEDTTDGNSNDI